jgi:hypothetical protein
MTCCHVLNTHDWLYERFLDCAPPAELTLTPSASDADVVIYLEPPWIDRRKPRLPRALAPAAWERVYVFGQSDAPLTWAPGVYASLPAQRQSGLLRGGFYVYHWHYGVGGLGDRLDAARTRTPDLLWSFVGSVASRPVLRGALLALEDDRGLAYDSSSWNLVVRWQAGESEFRAEAAALFADYAATLARSKFVLCPRGVGASSVRIFEAMRLGRVPVIISDDWTPSMFADWAACSLQIAEREIAAVPAILREREAEAASLGLSARAEWERLFAPEAILATLLRSAVAISDERPTRRRRLRLARALATREGLRRTRDALGRGLGS